MTATTVALVLSVWFVVGLVVGLVLGPLLRRSREISSVAAIAPTVSVDDDA